MALDLDNLEKNINKVTTNKTSYPMVFTGTTGSGKTYSMFEYTKAISPEGTQPLFVMFEDRYAHIDGILAERITSYPEISKLCNVLKSPKAKESFSCIIIDTANAMETMVMNYIIKNSTSNESVQVLNDFKFGKGSQLLKMKESFINNIREMGYPVFFTYQVKPEAVNFIDASKGEVYKDSLHKKTKEQVCENASFIGLITKDMSADNPETADRLITFTATSEHPDLKSSFPLPEFVKISDLPNEMDKAIKKLAKSEDLVSESKITVREKTVPFKELASETQQLAKLLADNGYMEEVENTIKTNLGYVDEENTELKKIGSLIETQYDLLEVVNLELKSWCDNYNLTLTE